MTVSNPKISPQQLFCILILSRLTMDIISPPPSGSGPLETIAAVVISELVRFVLALPVIIYSFQRNNFYRSVYTKSKALGWLSAVFAAALLIAAMLKTLNQSINFAEKNIFAGGAYPVMFAAVIIFSVYEAYMGIEAIARAGVLFLIAAEIITAAVFLADIPYMEITPMWSEGSFGTLFEDILKNLTKGGEYLIFAALLPYVNLKKETSAGNSILSFALVSTVISASMCAVNQLILREMYPLAEYPFAAAASLSDIALFKRLDGIFAAIWELCGAFRCGLILFSAVCVIMTVYRTGREKNPTGESL